MRISKKAYILLHLSLVVIVVISIRCTHKYLLTRYDELINLWRVDAETLIMGDSHAQVGIDENCFTNAINVSQSAETLVYTYYKLVKYLNANPQIENVILAVSHHSFSANDPSYIVEYMRRYRLLLDEKIIQHAFEYKDIRDVGFPVFLTRTVFPIGFLFDLYEYFQVSTRGVTPRWKGKQIYSRLAKIGNTEYLDAAISRHYYTKNKAQKDLSDIKRDYMEHIVSLCKQKSINLVIVTTPVHSSYFNLIPHKFLENFDKIIGTFKDDVKYVSGQEQNLLLKENYFQDYDHLNYKGAVVFSKYIKIYSGVR